MIAGEKIELYVVPDFQKYYPPNNNYIFLHIKDTHNVKWVLHPCTKTELVLNGKDESSLQISADSKDDLQKWLVDLIDEAQNLINDLDNFDKDE